jgi:hypothetical protein
LPNSQARAPALQDSNKIRQKTENLLAVGFENCLRYSGLV